MGRRLRYFEADRIYFVTARTVQGRQLLRPDARTAEVLGGVLARAAERYGIDVFAFVALSTHVHLLCRARDGSLAPFMQYVLGNAARKIGPLVNWYGRMWGDRYSAEPVLDADAMEERLRYILSHGVKEGLVDGAEDWPGLSCLPQLLGDPKRTFKYFNWTRRSKAAPSARQSDPYADQWVEPVVLELKPLPHWERLGVDERRTRVQRIIDTIRRNHAGRPKLGLRKVLSASPHRMHPKPQRRIRPWCHASDSATRARLRDSYRAFHAVFTVASRRYRNGDASAQFPPFAFKPVVRSLAA